MRQRNSEEIYAEAFQRDISPRIILEEISAHNLKEIEAKHALELIRINAWEASRVVLRKRHSDNEPAFITITHKANGRYNAQSYAGGGRQSSTTIANDPTLNHTEMGAKVALALCEKQGWAQKIIDNDGEVYLVSTDAS